MLRQLATAPETLRCQKIKHSLHIELPSMNSTSLNVEDLPAGLLLSCLEGDYGNECLI